MNSMSYQNINNLAIAENYYHHMLNKNFDSMAQCLHPDVHIISPLSEVIGKSAVIEAARNLSAVLDKIEIRAKFCSENQIMLAYDFMFPSPIGKLRAAVLMDFTDQLIARIELFYDGRPFSEEKKNEIFSKN